MLRGLDGARVCRVKTTRGAHALCENRDLRVSVCVLRPYSIRGIFIWPQYICKIFLYEFHVYNSYVCGARASHQKK